MLFQMGNRYIYKWNKYIVYIYMRSSNYTSYLSQIISFLSYRHILSPLSYHFTFMIKIFTFAKLLI